MEDRVYMVLDFEKEINVEVYRVIDNVKCNQMTYSTDSLSDIPELIKEYMKEMGI